jgi:hypothetical protein
MEMFTWFHGTKKFTPGTNRIGGWVGPRTGSGRSGEDKNLIIAPCQESNPGGLAHRFVCILTELLRQYDSDLNLHKTGNET